MSVVVVVSVVAGVVSVVVVPDSVFTSWVECSASVSLGKCFVSVGISFKASKFFYAQYFLN